jgi:hypothetical protein
MAASRYHTRRALIVGFAGAMQPTSPHHWFRRVNPAPGPTPPTMKA